MAKPLPSIELKTIAGTGDRTVDFGENSNKEDEDNLLHECSNGISIKFRNLIYRARQNIFWDRCK